MEEPAFKRLAEANVAVAGLGLMGGSLALALRGHCREIVGLDADPAVARAAVAQGAVDRVTTLEGTLDSDLIVLAAPVRAILGQLAALGQRAPGRRVAVLDLGSTKQAIVSAMAGLPDGFDPIGGHPMCGKEVSGLAHAEARLFRDKVFVLAPLARTTPGALALAQALVAAVGARPLLLEPARHDGLAAVSSHLPFAVAALLVGAAEALGDELVWTMVASGFRDTSRLAASDTTMMVDILLTNRGAVLAALARYREQLDGLCALLAAEDEAGLRALLDHLRAVRRARFPP